MELERSVRYQTKVSVRFATHLLSKEHNSNVVFSPVSMHVVLSVLAAGCKGKTLEELLAFLKTDTIDDLNSLYSQTMSSIFADGRPSGGPRLASANGVWVERTLSLKPSFKHVVDSVYKAACKQVDFQSKAAEVVKEVNLWAEKKTNGRIKNVLPANSANKFTTVILANAVYFKGAWTQKFDELKTKEYDFHLLNGNKVRVPFMTNDEKQYVCEFNDFKVLGLPYFQGKDKRRFTMYFFLPDAKDGLRSLIEKIGSTSDFFKHHVPHKKVEVSQFLIPKFKIEFGFEASDMLKDLGLALPFSNGLTEMVDFEQVYVSNIFHKSFVEVNEEGTEAAAVTVIMMVDTCSNREVKRPKKVDFVADHPFLFVIQEDVSGVVLFMGQVINPSVC